MKLTKKTNRRYNRSKKNKNTTQKGGEFQGIKSFKIKNEKNEIVLKIKKISDEFDQEQRSTLFALCMTSYNSEPQYTLDDYHHFFKETTLRTPVYILEKILTNLIKYDKYIDSLIFAKRDKKKESIQNNIYFLKNMIRFFLYIMEIINSDIFYKLEYDKLKELCEYKKLNTSSLRKNITDIRTFKLGECSDCKTIYFYRAMLQHKDYYPYFNRLIYNYQNIDSYNIDRDNKSSYVYFLSICDILLAFDTFIGNLLNQNEKVALIYYTKTKEKTQTRSRTNNSMRRSLARMLKEIGVSETGTPEIRTPEGKEIHKKVFNVSSDTAFDMFYNLGDIPLLKKYRDSLELMSKSKGNDKELKKLLKLINNKIISLKNQHKEKTGNKYVTPQRNTSNELNIKDALKNDDVREAYIIELILVERKINGIFFLRFAQNYDNKNGLDTYVDELEDLLKEKEEDTDTYNYINRLKAIVENRYQSLFVD